MARHPPPPDRHSLDQRERELELFYPGADEDAARAALVELRQRHNAELQAQADHRCGHNAELSMEALQRLDTRLWEKRKQYDPTKGRWITWAKTVLDRIITDLFRERARFQGAQPQDPTDRDVSPGDWTEQVPGREPPPDWRLKLEELQQAMTDCLQRLPPEERDALTLQVVGGLPLEEIGKRTGVREGTVGTRVYRARRRMRECLKRKGYEGGEV
jgi:RNA polymerase sigma-70 factor (ECF subfamily)